MLSRSANPRILVLAALLAAPVLAPAAAQDAAMPDPGVVDGGAIEGGTLAPIAGVDSGELAPVAGSTASGAGFSGEAWQGINLADADALMGSLALPVRSPALFGLWRRLLLSDGTPAAGSASVNPFLARRADSLYRSGLLDEASKALKANPSAGPSAGPAAGKDLGLSLVSIRTALAAGQDDQACAALKGVPITSAKLSKAARTEAILLTAYCVSKDKQPQNAAVALEVARDQGVKAPVAFAVLDSIANNKPPKLPKFSSFSLTDYRFLSLLGPVPGARVAAVAPPDVLVAIARNEATQPADRLAAAEAAARVNALSPEALAAAYVATPVPAELLDNPLAGGADSGLTRAALYQVAAATNDPVRRLQLAAALLTEVRRDGLQLATAPALASLIGDIAPEQSTLWFAEAAVETFIAAAQYDRAMPWAIASGGALLHWTLLIDIADPAAAVPVESALGYAEQMVRAGELSPAIVQRLATVLDALEYNVPLGIWDAAEQAPRDTSGHLPATGQLTALQEAAREKNLARTVLLTLSAYGTDTPDAANLLTLGDTIKALRAAGLDADARRLAVEALFAAWPRRSSG